MPDDKILSRGLNDLFFGHCRQGVDFENPLDLSQEPIQQPEALFQSAPGRRRVPSRPPALGRAEPEFPAGCDDDSNALVQSDLAQSDWNDHGEFGEGSRR